MTEKEMHYYQTLDKFVAYLGERNLFDPFIYNTAQRRLKDDGSRYWDCSLRGMPELYKECKAFTDQQAQFLALKFEKLDSIATCLPTRRTHEINEAMHKAWLDDYWISKQKGWSTE